MQTKTNSTHGDLLHELQTKVPLVTAFFWIIKVLATTVGETFADYLNSNLNMGLTNTSIVISSLTVIALIAQFRTERYVAGIYWLVVILISVAGTLITDNLSDNFGVPLQVTTGIFALCLTGTFILWFKSEGTLSIHSIRTPKRESFYWLTILFTFALGTAAGDLVNETYAVGYLRGLILFGSAIAILAIAYRFGLNAIITFWSVYVLTRPLGASLGDLLTQPVHVQEDGAFPGLGIDKYLVNGVFALLIVGLVTYLAKSKVDVIKNPES